MGTKSPQLVPQHFLDVSRQYLTELKLLQMFLAGEIAQELFEENPTAFLQVTVLQQTAACLQILQQWTTRAAIVIGLAGHKSCWL